jgi:tetratricopeptide (TPR) repeat protein
VLILPIAVTQYMKRRSIFLLPLIAITLLCLYATETKGAWLGFGISFFIFSVIYGYFFLRDKLHISPLKFLGLASIVPVTAFAVVIAFAYMRPTSVGFRVATWLSTFEMISSRPLTGLGVGCFKVIYPAYRRPVIFHIEGKHNTETDHAEQEHLEQVMDNGIIGAGIYFWIIAFVTVAGLRALSALTEGLKGARPPPVAYDLLGYITALLGMLAHNMTDVSMRFVSSGIFLGLLPGVILVLARGRALWELHYKEEAAPEQKSEPSGLYTAALWAVRLVALGGLAYTALLILRQFGDLQGTINMYTARGEVLQWYISWTVMLCCVGGAIYAYGGIILKGVSLAAPLVLLASLFPIYYFWGWFKGDVYHNMAIFFSKQGKWEDAITYYKRVNSLNQFFIMPYYFTGNVFNDRFNMSKTYRPEWGDPPDTPRDDYERAMDAYEHVRDIAPNYVQMHHQVGVLYLKMHDHYMRGGDQEKAQKYLDMALARFELYEKLDPVYELNYYRKAQIYIMRNQLAEAEREYLRNLNAWKCYVKDHKHETPEAYFNLANVQYGLKKFGEAAENYRHALRLNPQHPGAQRNLPIALAQQAAQRR